MAKSVKKISERTGTPLRINPQAKPSRIQPVESKDVLHVCVCCGKGYKKLQTNFPLSKSPLFMGNGGYVPICKNCMREYFKQVVEYFCGNQERAMERICSLMDIYYSPDIAQSSRKGDAVDFDPMLYPGRLAASAEYKDKQYLDTLAEGKNVVISNEDDFDKVETTHKVVITQAARKRWGLNWNPEEYKLLEEHYQILRQRSVNPDEQELQIHQMCEIYIMQYRARCKNDVSEYEKTTKLYNAQYAAGGFKTGLNKDDSFNQPLGVLNMIVEGVCPSDFYKDKKRHKDFEGYEDYWKRFIIRPFSNLINNKRDMDEEFSIKDGEK